MARKTEKKASEVAQTVEEAMAATDAVKDEGLEELELETLPLEDPGPDVSDADAILAGDQARRVGAAREEAASILMAIETGRDQQTAPLTPEEVDQMIARQKLLAKRLTSTTRYTVDQEYAWRYELKAIQAGTWHPKMVKPANPRERMTANIRSK